MRTWVWSRRTVSVSPSATLTTRPSKAAMVNATAGLTNARAARASTRSSRGAPAGQPRRAGEREGMGSVSDRSEQHPPHVLRRSADHRTSKDFDGGPSNVLYLAPGLRVSELPGHDARN